MTRLLTLTGAGGYGKTRLALKVATDLVEAYSDGVWIVDLAPLAEGELVPQAVAQAVGVREQPGRSLTETLEDALRTRKMLLVVDNCEHLIEAVVGLVDTILDSCPSLRVLATSRETLSAAGEVAWVVPSLTVPGARQEEAYTPQVLEAHESVRLFVERACQRDPSFVLTSRNGRAVAQVCRRLEGIPLPVGTTTSAEIEPDPERRLALVRAWREPDYASVNLSEPGAMALMEALVGIGVGIEAGVWIVEDAKRLAASRLGSQVTRILVEPGELQLRDSGDKATDALELVEDIHGALDELGLASPRLQHGDGWVTWVLLRDAVRRGLDTRVGLEDTLRGPDGERTTGNKALVRAARELGAA